MPHLRPKSFRLFVLLLPLILLLFVLLSSFESCRTLTFQCVFVGINRIIEDTFKLLQSTNSEERYIASLFWIAVPRVYLFFCELSKSLTLLCLKTMRLIWQRCTSAPLEERNSSSGIEYGKFLPHIWYLASRKIDLYSCSNVNIPTLQLACSSTCSLTDLWFSCAKTEDFLFQIKTEHVVNMHSLETKNYQEKGKAIASKVTQSREDVVTAKQKLQEARAHRAQQEGDQQFFLRTKEIRLLILWVLIVWFLEPWLSHSV